MKICSSLIFLFFVLSRSIGAAPPTQPEEIVPLTKATYSYAYYHEQADLWKMEIEQDRLSANAWLNYYRAARYANMLSEKTEKPFDTNAIIGKMPKELANTFEFHFMLFINDHGAKRDYSHLLKAHELAPERTEIFLSLVNYHILDGDWEQAKIICKKLFSAGEFTNSLLAWNYNALASVESNAILLTHGDSDTYPAWVMQAAKGVRPDVEVINVNLLFYDDYRNRVFAKLNIEPLDSAQFMEYQELYLAIAQRLMHQSKRPIYLGTGIPEFLRSALGDSLYLTGLAFKYSSTPFDNVAMLKNNFEKRFLLDHLKIQLEADTGSHVSSRMNLNYLPALIMLHRHYKASGENQRALEVENMTMQVAREGGREAELWAYFNKGPKKEEAFETSISTRDLDKALVKVKEGLYAFSTEVTNEQYEAFLMDLLKNKEFELLETCKAPKTDWRGLLPESFRHLPDSEVFKFSHPNDPGAPVQNISYEAAQRYCEWITKVYNHSLEKRKNHQQVQFRLPTEEEWEFAAHASLSAPFPWGGYYIKNTKGCYLSNQNVAEMEPCKDCPEENRTKANDGGFFPIKADAYFPNDFGLYNASGNVAEMVAEKGVAKGGSWEDIPENCTISSKKKYDSPSPAIGFRVFMVTK